MIVEPIVQYTRNQLNYYCYYYICLFCLVCFCFYVRSDFVIVEPIVQYTRNQLNYYCYYYIACFVLFVFVFVLDLILGLLSQWVNTREIDCSLFEIEFSFKD